MFIAVDGFNKTGIPSTLCEAVEKYSRIDSIGGIALLSVVILGKMLPQMCPLSGDISNFDLCIRRGSCLIDTCMGEHSGWKSLTPWICCKFGKGKIPNKNFSKEILLRTAVTRFCWLPMGLAADPIFELEARARRKGCGGRFF
ncbi:hypothetical protein IEQ34_008210 [Dendrobium chrysotoxum]|uniref:Uncharacterized protein n=1 Tax=Dendrobium chrysotoxum TaxID=161865 RepID=A0AAV7H7Q1_DENCH|nr:hypothetical protein IEQ34_008210 [Dendrobium chrysotoxum]